MLQSPPLWRKTLVTHPACSLSAITRLKHKRHPMLDHSGITYSYPLLQYSYLNILISARQFARNQKYHQQLRWYFGRSETDCYFFLLITTQSVSIQEVMRFERNHRTPFVVHWSMRALVAKRMAWTYRERVPWYFAWSLNWYLQTNLVDF